MFWTVITLSAIAAALLYHYITKSQSYWKEQGIKYAKPTFLFGENLSTLLRRENFLEMIQRIYNEFPAERYNGIYQFLQPMLNIRDPDLIKQVMIKDFDHFVDRRTVISEDTDPLFGKNLPSLKGQKWRDMRATLSPSFTSSKMKSMFILMSEVAENFVTYFKKSPEDTVSIELKDIFTRYTNDVIATSAFGVKVDSLDNKTNEFYMMGKRATDFTGLLKSLKLMLILMAPQLCKWLNLTFFQASLGDYFRNLVKDTIKMREEQHIVRPDMLNLLMEARKGVTTGDDAKIPRNLSDDDITAQALIFFFAGFDSVATMLCFMGYELAVNQDVQEKLREEIKENEKITYDALMKMKYLDMVVSETLRKWPNAVGVDRVCTKPYTIQPEKPEEKPVHLSEGSVITVSIYGLHRDPQYYPDPEKFDPERFSEENKGNINPYAYLPFGVGPRNCIGNRFALMEAKILMYHILNNFRIVPTEKSQIPLKISKKSISLTADGGFWFGFEKL